MGVAQIVVLLFVIFFGCSLCYCVQSRFHEDLDGESAGPD